MISKALARRVLSAIHGTDRSPNLLHPQYYFVTAHRRVLNRHRGAVRGICVDIGCGDRFYEAFYAGCYSTYLGVDYSPAADAFPGFQPPDVVADGARLPLRDGCVDTLLLIEVLEHVRRPAAVLAEAHRVLREGGCLLLSTPFAMPEHGQPFDYFRYTQYGLTYLLEQTGLAVRTVEPITSIGGIVAYFLNAFVVMGTFAPGRGFSRFVKMVFAPFWLLFWGTNNLVGWLWDRIVSKAGFTLNYFVLAEKPALGTAPTSTAGLLDPIE